MQCHRTKLGDVEEIRDRVAGDTCTAAISDEIESAARGAQRFQLGDHGNHGRFGIAAQAGSVGDFGTGHDALEFRATGAQRHPLNLLKRCGHRLLQGT
jgi:hypothetical protein